MKTISLIDFITRFPIEQKVKIFYKGILIDGKKMSRAFGQTLRYLGYYKLETGFYNNRPSIFKLLNGIDREEKKNEIRRGL